MADIFQHMPILGSMAIFMSSILLIVLPLIESGSRVGKVAVALIVALYTTLTVLLVLKRVVG